MSRASRAFHAHAQAKYAHTRTPARLRVARVAHVFFSRLASRGVFVFVFPLLDLDLSLCNHNSCTHTLHPHTLSLTNLLMTHDLMTPALRLSRARGCATRHARHCVYCGGVAYLSPMSALTSN